MSLLHLDVESRSTVDLKRCGVYVYAEHPDTNVWCVAYAIDDEPVKLWVPGTPIIMGDAAIDVDPKRDMPAGIEYIIKDNYTIVAHNAAFERRIWTDILAPRYGWPIPRLEQFQCTMVMALALSLPASLKNATRAVGIDDGGKADEGHRLMLQMSQPRKPRKGEDPDAVLWWDDAARIKRLCDVCKKDVEDERELHKRLLALRPSEQRLWQLDQIINDRGVYVDDQLCAAALRVVETATGWLNDEMRELTGGSVSKITNVNALSTWCREQGFPTESLDKEAIEDLLIRTDLTPVVRRVLEIRKEAAKAAVKKIDALVAGSSVDGRARGLLQFHAAGTGRWGGRRFQPQNIKRPQLDDVDGTIECVATGNADLVRLMYGEPLVAVGDCLRGLICAASGARLYAADFSNIEGRIIAWLAGEEWKLEAFRAFDAGTGHDIYHLTAGKILGKNPSDITKAERQSHGKVPELALGFQGGVAAFQKMAKNYGVEMSDVRAEEIKVEWRESHPNVCQFWYDLEAAAKRAVNTRGSIQDIGAIRFRVAGSFLFMRLPSGRCIAYPYPCIKPKMTPWGEMREQVSYKGVDTFTHRWTDCFAHGGLLFNNAVQGIARDVEAEAMTRVEAAGYPIVLTVHDEIVCEVPQAFGSVDEFQNIMVELPKWAEGLPVAAEAWSAERYRK